MRKTADSALGRRMKHRETLIGSSPGRARRHGITLQRRAQDAAGTAVSMSDGTVVEPRTVIWATGFGQDHSFLHTPVFDDQRRVINRRGETPTPGLYFLGLPWMHTRGSALLGWVQDDAAYLAERIAQNADAYRARASMAASR